MTTNELSVEEYEKLCTLYDRQVVTVRELITKLSTLDQDKPILFPAWDGTGDMYKPCGVKEIMIARKVFYNKLGEYICTEYSEWYDYDTSPAIPSYTID